MNTDQIVNQEAPQIDLASEIAEVKRENLNLSLKIDKSEDELGIARQVTEQLAFEREIANERIAKLTD